MSTAGTLFVVATPIGNLEDITLRALRVLREVALIAAEDTRRTSQLLARHGISTPTMSLREHNEAKKTPALVARLRSGDRIALVSDAGTPTIADPGRRLVEAALSAGIRVEPIPGPSAIMATLAASGLPADLFAFMGFPPIKLNDRRKWFAALKSHRGTIVFFEAPHRIRQTLQDLQAVVGDVAVVVARELTKTHEELVKRPISTILSGGLRAQGEFTVALELGRIIDNKAADAPGPEDLRREFGEITNNEASTRRAAISQLAKRHGMTPNAVYEAIERAKKSGNRPT